MSVDLRSRKRCEDICWDFPVHRIMEWIPSPPKTCAFLYSLQKHTNILGTLSKLSYTCSSLGKEAVRKKGATGLNLSETIRSLETLSASAFEPKRV